MADLQYPIGKFQWDGSATEQQLRQWIDEIAAAPAQLRAAVGSLSAEQIDTPYRPGGWTVRQVVHHVPESHMNAYIRFKLALTEDVPTVKPYDEAAWANLPDIETTPMEVSLSLLDALHYRWVRTLAFIDESGFARKYKHPEMGIVRLDGDLALYSWHGKHHVSHIHGLHDILCC